MTYERFERFAIAIAALAVLSMAAFSARDLSHNVTELVAEFLLLAVVIAAVHYGRRVGFAASLMASVLYIALSVPEMTAFRGVTSHTLLLIASRVFVFGLVGIVGGEACLRLRDALARRTNAEMFDDWSRSFNQRYAHTALTRAIAAFERYDQQFTLVLIWLAPAIVDKMGPQRARIIVRAVSKHLRSDVRMVDEIARLDDGRYFILLPHTPFENGRAAAARLVGGTRQLLGARAESVASSCLSPATNLSALKTLAEQIAPSPHAQRDSESEDCNLTETADDQNRTVEHATSAPDAST